MKIEVGDNLWTRDGRAVRILATDMRGGGSSIIGLITAEDGIEFPECWGATGRSMEHESCLDLFPSKLVQFRTETITD